jgi:putative NIF3 family GTP cyclohydrolase 1 type 2
MKLERIYELAVEKGLKADLRSQKSIDDGKKKVKAEYKNLKGLDKKTFDKDKLKHPYSDTRILCGSGSEEIKNIMVGIDIGVAELLLADRLKEKGVDVDLVISHHPSGRALAQLHEVMAIQPGLWQKYGLTEEVSEGLMAERMKEVARGVAPGNKTIVQDAAELLGIPFMCTHTVADNCVTNYLQKILNAKKPKKLKNVLSILKDIPEYKDGMKKGAGPYLLIGEDKDDAGKIFVDMTGGTSGPDKIFGRLAQAGVKTIIGMHCKESGYKVAKSEFINYVIAGHIASDNLGMNLLFDAIEKEGRLNFIECSGFRRVRRK